jgi:Dolichyl-phosphate-mannose-protein mannosyltransferase
MENQVCPRHRISQPIMFGILALVILLVAAIRIRLLALPLERDEGEYAYIGQLLLHGVPPGKLAYSMKLPGTSAAYAVIMAVFGQTAIGIHLGLVLLNAATTTLVFLLARRLMDGVGALVAAATFALLSVSPAVYGTAAHAAHFVLLPALAGFLVLLRALESNERRIFFAAGLLFGLAFLMKQSGVFFGIFGGVYLIYHEVRRQKQMPWQSLAIKGGLFLLGAALPFVLVCVMLCLAGTFKTFWYWTFSYAGEYGGMESINEGFNNLMSSFEGVIGGGRFLWIIAGLGIIQLCLNWRTWPRPMFVGGLLLFSFLAVCPGFYFRNHYFILLLPAVGMAAGLMVDSAQRWFPKTTPLRFVPVAVFVAAWGYSVFQERDVLLQLAPVTVCREMYAANPFPEAVEIAKYIKAHTAKNETVAILGSEPEICFYADRRSATGYIYMYPLTEPQPYELQMQRQMIREIETTKPDYVVLVGIITSWDLRSPSSQLIFDWFNGYMQKNLEPVGLVNILSPTQTDYYWKTENHALPPRSDAFLEVFKRKSAAAK